MAVVGTWTLGRKIVGSDWSTESILIYILIRLQLLSPSFKVNPFQFISIQLIYCKLSVHFNQIQFNFVDREH